MAGRQVDLLRAKYYRLTAAGRQLEVETEDWQRISLAITSALKAS